MSNHSTTNQVEPSRRRILVVADAPCPCPGLTDEVARRADSEAADVVVVAPALNSRVRHFTSDVDAAVSQADERARAAVDELHNRGVNARGGVGDASPLMAIEDALVGFEATEIVIATRPRTHWLERGVWSKAVARFGVPVTEFVARG